MVNRVSADIHGTHYHELDTSVLMSLHDSVLDTGDSQAWHPSPQVWVLPRGVPACKVSCDQTRVAVRIGASAAPLSQ